ncbi:MAG: A/G-specific adenine glycosylase [Deltaproteobacteria bacterium]|nr:A/G-specific adenine glycosylase [Deltaproteobacteria bacterium]
MDTVSFPQKKLIAWFQKHQRDLPWRVRRAPYSTWISEIMLQQTQVQQVVPYYHRFMERFPNIRSLAKATILEVLKVWEGMGYYSRARNLHQAAQIIVGRFAGKIPVDLQKLNELPGIGRSTAGAILSLAYNQPYAILDGNIRRVLIRFFNINQDSEKTTTIKKLWSLSQNILPLQNAGLFNEALMELGALICTPKNPACSPCPLNRRCAGFSSGCPEALPVKKQKKPIPHFDVTAAVIQNGKKILITQRPEKGLLGGLWEFPGGKKEAGESLEQCLKREIQEELNIEIRVGDRFMQVRHAYTHFKITLHCFFCRKLKGRILPLGVKDFRWVYPDELEKFPFPRADQKVIEFLEKRNTLDV